MRRVVAVLCILLPLFAGCQASLFGPEAGSDPPLEDEVNDVLRSDDIDYATFAPVKLTLGVKDETTASRAAAVEATGPVLVRIVDAVGETLFAAALGDDGTVSGEMVVPIDAPAVTLTVESPSHETRELTIEDPDQYEEVDRVLALTIDPKKKPADDRDADGIPDWYDAFPDDPTLAFRRRIPASDRLTIAFEDNYPNLGDGDYNDFVAEYAIVEHRGPKNKLVTVQGTATALARGALYQHEFGIVVDFPGLTAEAEIARYDGSGALLGTSSASFDAEARIVLFAATSEAFTREDGWIGMDNINPEHPVSLGYTTKFTLTYAEGKTTTTIDAWKPYDPYVLVSNPTLDYRPDIHLIGKEPLAGSENPGELSGFRDADGYPRALLVPNDWLWPREQTHIETAYPEFVDWRESLGTTNSDWYFTPVAEHVVVR